MNSPVEMKLQKIENAPALYHIKEQHNPRSKQEEQQKQDQQQNKPQQPGNPMPQMSPQPNSNPSTQNPTPGMPGEKTVDAPAKA